MFDPGGKDRLGWEGTEGANQVSLSELADVLKIVGASGRRSFPTSR